MALLLAWLLSSEAGAVVLVNPPAPLPQRQMGATSYTISLAGSDDPFSMVGGGYYNSTLGYRFIQTTRTNDENLVWLDVSSNQNFTVNAGEHIVVTLSTGTSSGTEIPLIGAGIVTSNVAPPACGANGVISCQGARGASNLSAFYERGKVLRLSFSVQALCQTSGATGSLCGATAPNYSNFQWASGGATLSQAIVVTFSVVRDYISTGAVSGTGNDSSTFTLQISNIPPSITCPGSIQDYYFPGDRQIYLTPAKYGFTTGPSGAVSGTAVKYLAFLASRGGVAQFSSNAVPSNEVVAYVDATQGAQAISGFVNASSETDAANFYQGVVYAQNEVGLLAPSPCLISNIAARSIRGVLEKGKCFIATAAFRDSEAAPVLMLRRFRDRVLSRFELGRRFIAKYYEWTPAWAEWAWDKPFIRSLALRALVPIELMAWALLKVSRAEEAPLSPEPYIDRVKKTLKTESPAETSHIEEIKKKLSPDPESGSYSEKLKATIGPGGEGSEGYSENERNKLPPEEERESPIEAVLSGKSITTKERRSEITQALSFLVGVNPNISVADTRSDPSKSPAYSTMYGSGWQPELFIHYERQLVHSEYLGSFGLHLNTGLTFGEGYGQLDFGFPPGGSTVSQTKFTFLQVPLLLGATYRFNLLRLVRPYIGASAGAIFYNESRKDDVGDKRGYTPVYAGHLGAALLLDYFDKGSARDGYLSMGIQHSYLVAEYLLLNSFSQSGVVFSRSGFYAGFLFEI